MILLQWHITNRCNLRCLHCYQESYAGDEMDLKSLLIILEQYKDFICSSRGKIRGHISVTGGEPFVRDDFPDLLKIFAEHKKLFSFGVLTNGTLIDGKMAHYLKTLGTSFVQVSIEGTKTTHDDIRGSGSFDRVITAIRYLVKAGVRTFISFTAHRKNFKEFKDVALLGQKLKVSRVWADRLIPGRLTEDKVLPGDGQNINGTGYANLDKELLTPDDTWEFFQLMQSARKKAQKRWFNNTEIVLHRALQFLVGGGSPYYCTAGESLITIMPDGDMLPCRRMPVSVGNVLDKTISDLYDCDFFQQLRNQNRISNGCENCFYRRRCRGGLKCLSYAVTGNPFNADPGCWIQNKQSV